MNLFSRLKMYLTWGSLIFLVNVILSLLAAVIYGILIYPLRKPIRWLWGRKKWYRWISFIFWIFLNDGKSNDVGYDWFWRAKNIYPNTWLDRWYLSYLWSGLRNPVWNIYQFIKPKSGKMENLNMIIGDDLETRVLKWKLKDGTPNDNIGDYLDYSKAKLGKRHFEYSIDGTNYFQLSKAFIKPVWNSFFHHELQVGWNSKRPKIRLKLKIKPMDKTNLKEFTDWYLKQ